LAAYPKVRCASGNQLAAALTTTGVTIVPPSPNRTLRIVGGWMRALGGTVGTASHVNFGDTSGTDEVMVATAGNMTANLILRENSTGMASTKLGTALTKGDGIRIHGVGGTVGTATSVDYCCYYTVEGG
jgi:hypothetical protein